MKRYVMAALFAALTVSLTGCGLLVMGAVVTTAAVTEAGYAVYETGEKVVSATGDAAQGAAKGVQEIVFFNNEMKASCPADVRTTNQAAMDALRSLGFAGIVGRADAASGRVEAVTSANEKIEIGLKCENDQQTAIRIRVGTRGNLKTSKLIYDRILAGLKK